MNFSLNLGLLWTNTLFNFLFTKQCVRIRKRQKKNLHFFNILYTLTSASLEWFLVFNAKYKIWCK